MAIQPTFLLIADIADGFRRVYEYCLQSAAEGHLESVAFILRDDYSMSHFSSQR